MRVNPNKFDVRVIRKFKKQFSLTDKEIEKELKSIKPEPEDNHIWMTGAALEGEALESTALEGTAATHKNKQTSLRDKSKP